MKHFLLYLTFLCLSVCFNTLKAQGQICITGGGPSSDQAHSMVQSNDGGYVVAGQTSSFGAGLIDIYVMKTNAVGTVIWTKTIGGIGNDYGRSIIKTFDGGYAIAGTTASYGAGGDDFYLVKLDAAGNVQWNKSYGGTGTDQGWEVVQTPDSGFCIAGQTASFGASPNDFYVVRTDASGNLVWDKKVGAAGLADIAYSITNTNDGGFAVAGTAYTWTGSGSTSSNDFYIVKLDGSGNMVWSRLVQDVNTTRYPDYARSIIQTADGGYMVAGEAGQPKVSGGFNWHYLLVKLDAAGAVSWTRYYGGTQIANVSTDGSDYAESVIQMANGDYLVGGYTFSFNYNFNNSQQVGLEYYLVRVSGTGSLISTHIIGTAQNDIGKCLIKTNDGGYMIAGYSQELVAGTYPDEIYLVKLDASLNTCCTIRSGGADRGTGPTNTTRGVSAAAGGTSVSGGLYGSGGSTTVLCGLPSLTAAFQTSQAQLCQPNSCVNFTDISNGSPSSWSWSFPGAIPATSNLQNPSNICYNTPGSYPVTLIVSNGVNIDTLVMPNYITLSASPAVPTITTSGPTTICSGDTLLLTSSYPSGNTWSPNGLNTQTIAVTNAGSYSVSYTGLNGCQASSLPIIVVVNPSPTAPIVSPAGPIILCSDGSIQLYSNILGGNTWFPDGETTDTILVFAAGSYFVTNTIGGCTSQASNIVVVSVGSNPPPPIITQSNDTLFCTLAASYQWYLNGVLIPGETFNYLVATASGSYTVYVTNEYGCGNTSEPYNFTFINALTETNTTLFEVYPNPTNQSIHVVLMSQGDFYIQVRDLQGKLIEEKKALNETEIDLKHVGSGVYFVSVVNDLRQIQIVKVIKLD